MGRMDGKVALITGAARGQGRSHAVRLAQEGADVVVLDLPDTASFEGLDYPLPASGELDETVEQVRATGRQAIAVRGDVRDHEQLVGAVAKAVTEFGHIDVVCANAGIATYASTADLTLTERQWQDVIDVNLTGVWNTCRAAIPQLTAGSAIVLTASVAGMKGIPNAAHYVAAKHGVLGITRALAHELAPRMIRINAVMPATVPTPMVVNDGLPRLFRPDLENPTFADAEAVFETLYPMPIKWVEEIDISNAVLFLASDEARYITGTSLSIDGGALA